jgi:hypothetical protein
MFSMGITAYASAYNKDESLARLAWEILLNDQVGQVNLLSETQMVDK